jgi:hypothetical protein
VARSDWRILLRADHVSESSDLIRSMWLRSHTGSVLKDLILAIRIRPDGQREERERLTDGG